MLYPDTYLDVIERATYSGSRRKTVKKGLLVWRYPISVTHFFLLHSRMDFASLQVRNLYGITLFENDLFVTNWRDERVYRINKFTGDSTLALESNKSRPFSVHVYHRQRQPEGTRLQGGGRSGHTSRVLNMSFVVF